MAIKVFVLGRPGSGKSTAARYLLDFARDKGHKVTRIKDYPILYQMFCADREEKFRCTEYEGFDVLDLRVFDSALKQLECQLKPQPFMNDNDRVVTIEFARDEYLHSLDQFSPNFLRGAYFLFVDAKLETCIQRIHTRVLERGKPDCHFVSDYIMRSYYNKSTDWEWLMQEIKWRFGTRRVEVIRNTDDLPCFLEEVAVFATHIFSQQSKVQEELTDLAIVQS